MRKFSREEQFGFTITGILHFIVLLIALFMATEPEARQRSAFIEVTLGEFHDGTVAEFAREPETLPQTSPDPVETITEEPEPVTEPEIIPEPEPVPEEPVRDVDLPDQDVIVDAEVVTTPDTEKVDPAQQLDETRDAEERQVPATAQPDVAERRGEEEAGDIRGIRGRVEADQGTQSDPIRSAPFQLEWEGDINRSALVQPLPNYVAETEAVISVRFEVRPDGTVGRLQPIIKANPALEREVLRTLRTWRFSRLPANLPQESQYGTITFRFVLE